MTKKQAIDEWTKAFGQWHEAGSAVWAIAMKKIDRGFPNAIETKRAQQKLEAAHQRLVRAVDGL